MLLHAFVLVPVGKKRAGRTAAVNAAYSFIPAHAFTPLYTLTQLLAKLRQSLGNQKEIVWVTVCVCEYLCVLGRGIECLPRGIKQTQWVKSVWLVLGKKEGLQPLFSSHAKLKSR